MALTRKFLSALGIEDEKIDEIITAHSETVNALKEQRDEAKARAEKLESVEKEFNEYKVTHTDGENPFEDKYNKLKSEFDEFKKQKEAEDDARAKKSAYDELIKGIGFNDKLAKLISDKADLSDIKIVDGKIDGADKIIESLKNDYPEFIETDSKQGAITPNPHSNKGGGKTKEEILAIKDTVARQAEMAKNPELFGI